MKLVLQIAGGILLAAMSIFAALLWLTELRMTAWSRQWKRD
jgi:hypothetical protein